MAGRFQVVVPAELRGYFCGRRIDGHGGFQTLGRLLQTKLSGTSTLTLTADELRRVVHYARAYGDGGFQTKLQKLVVEFVHQNWQSLVS